MDSSYKKFFESFKKAEIGSGHWCPCRVGLKYPPDNLLLECKHENCEECWQLALEHTHGKVTDTEEVKKFLVEYLEMLESIVESGLCTLLDWDEASVKGRIETLANLMGGEVSA